MARTESRDRRDEAPDLNSEAIRSEIVELAREKFVKVEQSFLTHVDDKEIDAALALLEGYKERIQSWPSGTRLTLSGYQRSFHDDGYTTYVSMELKLPGGRKGYSCALECEGKFEKQFKDAMERICKLLSYV